MDEMENTMIGRGRDAIEMIVDAGSFDENKIGTAEFDPDYGPGAVVGTAKLKDETVTVIANDAYAFNDRFPVVFGGVIGLEEGYKMATAVYRTMEADKDKRIDMVKNNIFESIRIIDSKLNKKNGCKFDGERMISDIEEKLK